jgi:hypothetical protein
MIVFAFLAACGAILWDGGAPFWIALMPPGAGLFFLFSEGDEE